MPYSKTYTIPVGMTFKKYHCSRCGEKLKKEQTHRVVTKEDRDYYEYQERNRFPRREQDVYGYRFKCPRCHARISFDEQCILKKIQKMHRSKVLPPSVVKESYETYRKAHHKRVLRSNVANNLILLFLGIALWFFFGTGRTSAELAYAGMAYVICGVLVTVGAIQNHKGSKTLWGRQRYSYEKKSLLKKLHALSSHNKERVESSEKCYCFYCISSMESSEISEYTDDGHTAKCPKCGIDSVIPGNVDEAIDEKLLEEMNEYWF